MRLSIRGLTKAACCLSVAVLTCFAAPLAYGGEVSTQTPPELKPVADLARRVVPWIADKLVLIHIPKVQGQDVFELRTESAGDPGQVRAARKLVIRASDPVSAAMGLNY